MDGRTLSQNLRDRVVASIDGGMSCRAAAAHFGVSISSAIRRKRLALRHGRAVAKPRGGDRHSGRIEAHTDFIKGLIAEQGDITLAEIQARLAERGVSVGIGTVHRLLARHGITRKKIGHAIEQDQPDVLRQRQRWFDDQLDLDPERLVFISKTSTATNMTRSHGRCPRGERLRMGFPHGHRKTTTLAAGLRMIGMVAPMVLDGPINGDWFEAYVTQVLVPELRPGDIVSMDNLSGTNAQQ
jgi:transposase